MKENKELILITNRYPYYPGEEFLTKELSYLAAEFGKIHLIPVNVEETNRKRELESNVIVHLLPELLQKKRLKKVSALLDPQGLKWFKEELANARPFGTKGIGKLASWLSVAEELRDNIEKIIGERGNNTAFAVYSYWLSLAGGAAMVKERNPSVTAVSRGHGGDVYEDRHNPPYLPLKHAVINGLDKVFLISENGFQHIANQKGSKDKLEVARLGTEYAGKRYESGEEGFQLLSCSYMVPVKRIPLLIEALSKCKAKIEWTHIGDGPEKEAIESAASELPKNIKATFTGNLQHDKVLEYYQTHHVDLFINVSESEGIPVTIMEAYSFGVPALATDVGGTSEIVNDQSGVLVRKDISPEELAGKIDELASDMESMYKKRNAAFQLWDSRFNAEKNYRKFANDLMKMVSHNNG